LRLGSAYPSNPRPILHTQGGPPNSGRLLSFNFLTEFSDGGTAFSRLPTKGNGGREKRT
jgi:hypothetical protein